ncbi:MAG: hypothetical protein AMS17_10130 [Spirochaetes bacterium DG_61]|jgi:hypothetical protein|nr:MAG: hypothetical protein AMS17_10130 [Spirochaetes bacterium DG_61]
MFFLIKKRITHIFFFLLALLVFYYPCRAEKIIFNLAPHFFIDNTEIVSPHRKSETIFGNSLKSYFTFYQSDRLTLMLGLWGILYYGEEEFLSDVKPLASYTYNLHNSFLFTMGVLDNENRHNMFDALLSEQLEYTRQIDYGFQVQLKNEYASLDLWMNWNLLNTPEHREYLNGGINLYVYLSNYVFNLQRYWSHHGGQLYHVGPMLDNYSLAVGVEKYFPFKKGALHRIGQKVYYLAYDEVGTITSQKGYGWLGELYISFLTFRVYLDYWNGNDFYTEEGNPLYQHDGWIFCGFRNESKISRIASFVFEFRMHYLIDTGISSTQVRGEIKSTFGYPLTKKQ